MTFRNLLLRLYPPRWRAEYGQEFAAVLETQPLGVSTVADILAGAARQQGRERGGWWALLALGTTVSAANLLVPFGPRGGPMFGLAILLVSTVAAFRARMRGASGYGAAMKVFLLCWGPDLLLAELVCLRIIPQRPLVCFHIDDAGLPSAWAFTWMGALVMVLELCLPATLGWFGAAVARRAQGR